MIRENQSHNAGNHQYDVQNKDVLSWAKVYYRNIAYLNIFFWIPLDKLKIVVLFRLSKFLNYTVLCLCIELSLNSNVTLESIERCP